MQLPEPPRPGPFERLGQRLIMLRGVFVILWNQLRRVLGKSYDAGVDPWAAGVGGDTYTDRDVWRSFNPPAWHEGKWTRVGVVECLSGRLIVADPMEFPSCEPGMGVVIDDVPVGVHQLELQRFRAGRGFGRIPLRARVRWGGLESSDFEYVGAAGVDLGALSIADAGRTAELTYDQVEEAGFEPNGLIIGDVDYDCIDPLDVDGTDCFLHVFRSGFGDGSYPVFRIYCAGKSCGILIDMSGLLDPDELEVKQ